MKVFAVLDIRANHYLKPTGDSSTANALRSFEVLTNEKGTTFNLFPDDFALYEIAEFNVQSGGLTPHSAPVRLATARSLLRVEPAQPVQLGLPHAN